MSVRHLLGAALLLGLTPVRPAVAGEACCNDPHYSQAWKLPGDQYLCSPLPCFGGVCCQILPFPT